ncbi:MAG: glycerol-3-phosphate 1-O-acyltransferase PlsY [Clostridia bacterium]|nr:glycerol-3-phosphate 1-O-acyltransferase PlsY [Clostridia bacterium]
MTFAELMYKGYLGIFLEETGTRSGFAFFSLIVLAFLAITILPYLLGSCNFSIIISKMLYHEDIRTFGSGNAGMTNMLRTYGVGAAAATLVTDAAKAVISALLGRLVFGVIGAYIAGLACVLGHIYPVFYKFKGGKGVVTAAITILMTNWKVGLVLIGMFVILVGFTKYISLGSVMCCLIYPLVLDRMNRIEQFPAPQIVMIFALAITVVIVLKHTSNIKRLISGTENKLSFTKKDRKPAEEKVDKK